jgi:hypothetical protein
MVYNTWTSGGGIATFSAGVPRPRSLPGEGEDPPEPDELVELLDLEPEKELLELEDLEPEEKLLELEDLEPEEELLELEEEGLLDNDKERLELEEEPLELEEERPEGLRLALLRACLVGALFEGFFLRLFGPLAGESAASSTRPSGAGLSGRNLHSGTFPRTTRVSCRAEGSSPVGTAHSCYPLLQASLALRFPLHFLVRSLLLSTPCWGLDT